MGMAPSSVRGGPGKLKNVNLVYSVVHREWRTYMRLFSHTLGKGLTGVTMIPTFASEIRLAIKWASVAPENTIFMSD